jgi:hypothetical protein
MFSITAFEQWLGELPQLVGIDESHAISRFFDRADLQALTFFDDLYELGRLHQRIERACIEPRGAAVENADL